MPKKALFREWNLTPSDPPPTPGWQRSRSRPNNRHLCDFQRTCSKWSTPLTPFWFGLPPSADQVQREIVVDLIIVIVITNKEWIERPQLCTDWVEQGERGPAFKGEQGKYCQTGGCLDHHHPQRQWSFFRGEIICNMHPHWIYFVMTILEIFT